MAVGWGGGGSDAAQGIQRTLDIKTKEQVQCVQTVESPVF
jgi:hypothetical protein